MNRSYSLRNTRPPTAAQLASGGPPPVSNARSNRHFTHSLATAFRRSNATVFAPELAKKLAYLVKMEKTVMRDYETLGHDRKESAKQLSLWGEDCDDDVSDITDKLAVLLYEAGELEDSMVDRYDQYRIALKQIRNTEASVQPSRDRKQKILDQIYTLKHKDPNSQKLVTLEQELVRAEAEYLVADAQLSNDTRQKLKLAMIYNFDAMQELGEKLALIAGYGRELLDILDENPVTPGEIKPTYDGYEASRGIILRAEYELNNWAPERVTGTSHFKTREQLMMDPNYQQLSNGNPLYVQNQQQHQQQHHQPQQQQFYQQPQQQDQQLYQQHQQQPQFQTQQQQEPVLGYPNTQQVHQQAQQAQVSQQQAPQQSANTNRPVSASTSLETSSSDESFLNDRHKQSQQTQQPQGGIYLSQDQVPQQVPQQTNNNNNSNKLETSNAQTYNENDTLNDSARPQQHQQQHQQQNQVQPQVVDSYDDATPRGDAAQSRSQSQSSDQVPIPAY